MWISKAASGLFVASLLLPLFCHAQLTCNQAITLHEYAIQTLGNCELPAYENNALCGQIGEFENLAAQNTSEAGPEDPSDSDQIFFISNPYPDINNWQNYLLQGAATQVADIGEISYVVNQINASYSQINATTVTNDEYYAAWQQPWFDQADVQFTWINSTDTSEYSFDGLARSQLLWKAANYLFTGFWPYPFSADAVARASQSVEAFNEGLDAHPNYVGTPFTTTFNNGSATTNIPGILITPVNNATEPPPLLIITGGTDFPKEMNVLQFGLPALERGYALIVYDGPGQGQVIRNPPYMPFFAQWDQVLARVLDYVVANFGDLVQTNNIAQQGVSLGGYLGSRACSGNSDRLVACLPNPPIREISSVYGRFLNGIAESIYAPFKYVTETEPSLLPDESTRTGFSNITTIIQTLVNVCEANSTAPQLIAESLASGEDGEGPVDPEIVYLSGGYGGAVTGNLTELYATAWQALRNTRSFGTFNISNITVPVIAFKGTQDDLLGGQEDEFYAELSPSVANRSTLLVFNGSTGGALHSQVGAPISLAARQFARLNAISLYGGGVSSA